ncbi:protein phosphatase 2C domain-containing protein [Actinocorallia sp. API 0066]|uniref:protein phosphatase 2C domain-containing protein n=1 Tax=Actinocorallia sp. API 0066 TaxID=2896846 RepID=UPI001E5ACE41|nr:protein phosphatase 2C domain-containing protein [Actinocorallia sp. API 0066]MCD0447621.1 protein phosphatase 2C domain-containing protein [Actinocorallia sp. API 0066]
MSSEEVFPYASDGAPKRPRNLAAHEDPPAEDASAGAPGDDDAQEWKPQPDFGSAVSVERTGAPRQDVAPYAFGRPVESSGAVGPPGTPPPGPAPEDVSSAPSAGAAARESMPLRPLGRSGSSAEATVREATPLAPAQFESPLPGSGAVVRPRLRMPGFTGVKRRAEDVPAAEDMADAQAPVPSRAEREPTVPCRDEETPVYTPPALYDKPHQQYGTPKGLPPKGGRPDTVIDGADLAGLTVRGTSQRGDDHRWLTEVRQDSMGLWPLEAAGGRRALLVAVADGVGSQPMSHQGSELACSLLRAEAERVLPELLDAEYNELQGLWSGVFGAVSRGMTEHIERVGGLPVHWSTTLVALLVEYPTGWTHAVRVGDSNAYVLRDGAFQPLFEAKGGGEIATNRTSALPGHTGPAEVAVFERAPDDVAVACTDGLGDTLRHPGVAARLAAQWGAPVLPTMLEFAWQAAFRVKSHSDDRTVVCVWGR